MYKKEFDKWLTKHEDANDIWKKYRGKMVEFKGDTPANTTGIVIGWNTSIHNLIVQYDTHHDLHVY